MDTLVFLPQPKTIAWQQGVLPLTASVSLIAGAQGKALFYPAMCRLQAVLLDEVALSAPIWLGNTPPSTLPVQFSQNDALAPEAYMLEVRAEGIFIESAGSAGAQHAVATLRQLIIQCGRQLPCVHIEDAPDFPVRGLLYDVARMKIPKMETLYRLVDMMADLKMNLLMVYLEGYPFAYASYPQVWQGGTPITGQEFIALDRYCAQKGIELVPTQNTLGHMGAWLSRDEFLPLAECPDGYEGFWAPGEIQPPATVAPQSAAVDTMIDNLTADLLPYFSSDYYNVCLDEPYELGLGKSKARADAEGVGRVYLDYVLKIHRLVGRFGKKMMFWGDIINQYPDLIPEIPKDVTVLEWGYEAESPYAKNCPHYQQAGLRYYVCPGTASWNAICGRVDKMMANHKNAATNGLAYGASGFIVTDWGDGGHWQHLPTIYPGVLHGAAISWNASSDIPLEAALNRFVFRDSAEAMGSVLLGIGRLPDPAAPYNSTVISAIMRQNLDDMRTMNRYGGYDFAGAKSTLQRWAAEIAKTRLACDDAALIYREINHGIALLCAGCDFGTLKMLLAEGRKPEAVEVAKAIKVALPGIIAQLEHIWLERNRQDGLSQSLALFGKMIEQCDRVIDESRPVEPA